MKASRARTELSSVFGFSGQQTLVSYVPKKNKAVILLSTLHHDKVLAGNTMKPEIILRYNQTKSGVDNLDHLITNYTCKQKTNRWPMALFMNVLDVAGTASLVVWLANNPTWNERRPRQRRRIFLVELGEQLVREQIRRRVQTDGSTAHWRSERQQLRSAFGVTLPNKPLLLRDPAMDDVIFV